MYIKVRVVVKSKRESVVKKNDDTYLLSVKEPSERNLANRRICEIMSDNFKIPLKNIRIISGHQTPSKILSINLPENLV